MPNFNCYICYNSDDNLYRICNCSPGSFVCESCINELEQNIHFTCPLCRQNLNVQTIYHRIKQTKYICRKSLLFSIILFFEVILPIIMIKTEYNKDDKISRINYETTLNNSSIFIFMNILSIFLIQPLYILIYNYINFIDFNSSFKSKYTQFYIKFVFMTQLFGQFILYIINSDFLVYQYITILLFGFIWLPLFSLIIVYIVLYINRNINTCLKTNFMTSRIQPISG